MSSPSPSCLLLLLCSDWLELEEGDGESSLSDDELEVRMVWEKGRLPKDEALRRSENVQRQRREGES